MTGKINFPRLCYRCKYPLYFSDYLSRNKQIPKEELKKVWENENVELLCCGCYKRCKSHPNLINDRLIKVDHGEKRAELWEWSNALQQSENEINLELIDFYKHTIINGLFFIDYYHDINIRYRYVLSEKKATLVKYVAFHKRNNYEIVKKKILDFNTKNSQLFYSFYEKIVEL